VSLRGKAGKEGNRVTADVALQGRSLVLVSDALKNQPLTEKGLDLEVKGSGDLGAMTFHAEKFGLRGDFGKVEGGGRVTLREMPLFDGKVEGNIQLGSPLVAGLRRAFPVPSDLVAQGAVGFFWNGKGGAAGAEGSFRIDAAGMELLLPQRFVKPERVPVEFAGNVRLRGSDVVLRDARLAFGNIGLRFASFDLGQGLSAGNAQAGRTMALRKLEGKIPLGGLVGFLPMLQGWKLSGDASVSADLAGTLDQPTGEVGVVFSAASVERPGGPKIDLGGAVRFNAVERGGRLYGDALSVSVDGRKAQVELDVGGLIKALQADEPLLAVEGKVLAAVKELVVSDTRLEEISFPVAAAGGKLRAEGVSARVGGGTVRASALVDASVSPYREEVSVRVDKVLLNPRHLVFLQRICPFLAGGGEALAQSRFTVSGQVRLEAQGKETDALLGSLKTPEAGMIDVEGGQLELSPMLAGLSLATGRSISNPYPFDKMHNVFRIADRNVQVERAELLSPDLQLVFRGVVGFDGKLDGRLEVRGPWLSGMDEAWREVFEGINAKGGLRVTGTVSEPRYQDALKELAKAAAEAALKKAAKEEMKKQLEGGIGKLLKERFR
jgi:hypothetical protein